MDQSNTSNKDLQQVSFSYNQTQEQEKRNEAPIPELKNRRNDSVDQCSNSEIGEQNLVSYGKVDGQENENKAPVSELSDRRTELEILSPSQINGERNSISYSLNQISEKAKQRPMIKEFNGRKIFVRTYPVNGRTENGMTFLASEDVEVLPTYYDARLGMEIPLPDYCPSEYDRSDPAIESNSDDSPICDRPAPVYPSKATESPTQTYPEGLRWFECLPIRLKRTCLRILRAMKRYPSLPLSQINKIAKVSRSQGSYCKEAMCKHGLVKRKGNRITGEWIINCPDSEMFKDGYDLRRPWEEFPVDGIIPDWIPEKLKPNDRGKKRKGTPRHGRPMF